MSDDVKDTETPAPKAKSACVMTGHIIDHATGEAFVAVFCAGGNRLSIAGARILAAQIVQWADHAEKHNAERPKDAVMRFMYKMRDVANTLQPAEDGVGKTDPNEGREGYVRKRKIYTPGLTDAHFTWVPADSSPVAASELKRKAAKQRKRKSKK